MNTLENKILVCYHNCLFSSDEMSYEALRKSLLQENEYYFVALCYFFEMQGLLLHLDKAEKQIEFENKFEYAIDIISLSEPTDEMFSLKANLYGLRLKTANIIEGIKWKAQALYYVEKALTKNTFNYRAILAEAYVKLFTKSADASEIKGRLNAAIHIIENKGNNLPLHWGKDLCFQLMAFVCTLLQQNKLATDYLNEATSFPNALKLNNEFN